MAEAATMGKMTMEHNMGIITVCGGTGKERRGTTESLDRHSVVKSFYRVSLRNLGTSCTLANHELGLPQIIQYLLGK